MTLHRLKLRPRSPWRTPWQADTLTGMLLATCARTHGPDVLRDRLIEPMLAGTPPFILSDALPGDLLPFPIHLRLADWPEETNLKALKRARWLTPDHFQAARAGRCPPLDALIPDSAVFLDHTRQHNTLSRDTDTTFTAEQGGGIYQRPETLLLDRSDNARDYLSIYFRILDSDRQAAGDLLLDLLHELSLTGFGADTSTGRGQFDILGDPQPMPDLNTLPDSSKGANAAICLSTFQPGPGDPADGYWESFPKFAKLGPELASLVGDHRKNTIILFRPGACFHTDPGGRAFLGHAIPMQQLLTPDSAKTLAQHHVNIIHPAFALTVHAYLPTGKA